MKIAIVDDSATARMFIRRCLGIPRFESGPVPGSPDPGLRWDLTVDNLPFTLFFCYTSP